MRHSVGLPIARFIGSAFRRGLRSETRLFLEVILAYPGDRRPHDRRACSEFKTQSHNALAALYVMSDDHTHVRPRSPNDSSHERRLRRCHRMLFAELQHGGVRTGRSPVDGWTNRPTRKQ
jgi:hypothetical protein